VTSFFTSRERKVILFLSCIFLIGNGIRLYKRAIPPRDIEVLDLGSLDPADSVEVARLLESSLELRRQRDSVKDVEFPLDINKAEAWELIALPGIGPERAERILEIREKRGEFQSLTDLLDVPGIGDRTLETIRGLLRPITPVPKGAKKNYSEKIDINQASREQLESLPGIGKVLAGRIIACRENGEPFQAIEDLKNVKGIGDERLKELEPFLEINNVENESDL
jgi:competence protein ComEA